ncbi:MAG TPA: branched-chain amino acid ABC transporter substrate-binding protein [Actinomycetota bacterium]|jgi:branched-chain amino acid transport system substrate-binding protein|nr:branched-chain amino acid ABC transporter substrate-binding protein [Actinomycetota bacterium]
MRRSKWFSLLALLFALSLFTAACADDGGGDTTGENGGGDAQAACDEDEFGCVEIAEGSPLTLGTLLVITGENASLGLDSQAGVELAADYYADQSFDGSPGEVLGHTIEFDHQDDGCSPEGGTTGARALSSNESIVAVIGTSCSSAGEPASQILSDAGIVLISPSNTAPSLTDPETHQPFYFRTAHNDKIQGSAMAQFVAEELGHTTAATVHDGSPYAEQLQQVFADTFSGEYGGEITSQEAVQVGQKDMTPVLTNIASGSPEFLYFPVFVAEGGLLTAQARETSGLENTDLGGADGMLTPDWIDAAGAENAEGAYLSGPDLEFSGDFYDAEFLPAYEETVGSEPTSVFHAHAFDATNMVLQAIEEVAIQEGGTTYIPRTALRDALVGATHDGITGALECDENGDCNQDATISVSVVENGKFKRIWPE